MKRALLAGAAIVAAFAVASPASALITINVGAGAVQPDENLLFNNNPAPGLLIEGITNQTNTLVGITGGETLVAAGGQARLDTSDGRISTLFTFEGFANQLVGFDEATGGLAFDAAEFRLFGGTATQATLTFVDTDGEVFQNTFAIPSSGFFSAVTSDGQLIDYFSIAANGTIGDVRQIRLGGVQAYPGGGGGGGGAIPEPSTWAMMILGFGAAGSLLRRRRQTVFG